MKRLVCCTLGMLVGDAFMAVPAVRDLCAERSVRIVCGEYDRPVWEWAMRRVRGCDYVIEKVIWNEDEVEYPTRPEPNPWVPGYGYITMSKALDHVRSLMPADDVIGCGGGLETYYDRDSDLEFTGLAPCSRDFVTVHPYTHHDWKNCDNVFQRVRFSKDVRQVGWLKQMPVWPHAGDFDAQADAVVESCGTAGVLSSWTNLACLTRKRQIIASFTPDVAAYVNARAVKLITPTPEELQTAINEMGW